MQINIDTSCGELSRNIKYAVLLALTVAITTQKPLYKLYLFKTISHLRSATANDYIKNIGQNTQCCVSNFFNYKK